MKLRSIRDIKNLKGKTVLLRVDFNVPVTKGRVDASEDFRLVRVLPTITFLLKKGAWVILLSHRGRPEGKVRKDVRLEPIAKRLRQLVKFQISNSLSPASAGWAQEGKILPALFPAYTIAPGVTMLENLRFDPREEANDSRFAKALASLGDLFVNDAFAVSHRKNTSVHAITKYLPSYAGLLMEEEVRQLSSIWQKPKRPLVVILGGAKISTKFTLIQKFLRHADAVLLGGGLANTLLKLRGVAVGASLVEEGMERLIPKRFLYHYRLFLPKDVVVAKGQKPRGRIVAPSAIQPEEAIVDIGPETARAYAAILASARMVVWNGPMGIMEVRPFRRGTETLLRAIVRTRAVSIVGGGESVQLVRLLKLDKRFSFVSTGGGAMLEFLEKGKLPGIEVLRRSS